MLDVFSCRRCAIAILVLSAVEGYHGGALGWAVLHLLLRPW